MLIAIAGLVTLGLVVGGFYFGTRTDHANAIGPSGLPGLSGVPGDTDADGTVSPEEKSALDATTKTVEKFQETLFATKGVHSVLVTPAGEKWWQLVTSVAAPTSLSFADAPSDVSWYALTDGEAFSPLSKKISVYQALHLKFTSDQDAIRWVQQRAAAGEGEFAQSFRGDGVVTVTPVWVDPAAEPYEQDLSDAGVGEATVDVAYWSIDFDAHIEALADATVDPEGYRSIWRNLGFADGATWQATSASPDGAWVGPISGFDRGSVDVGEAGGAINTFRSECYEGNKDTGPTCDVAFAAREAIYEVFLQGGGRSVGDPEWRYPGLPSDYDVYFGRSASFQGHIEGRRAYYHPAVPLLAMWVTGGDTLTIYPQFSTTKDG